MLDVGVSTLSILLSRSGFSLTISPGSQGGSGSDPKDGANSGIHKEFNSLEFYLIFQGKIYRVSRVRTQTKKIDKTMLKRSVLNAEPNKRIRSLS